MNVRFHFPFLLLACTSPLAAGCGGSADELPTDGAAPDGEAPPPCATEPCTNPIEAGPSTPDSGHEGSTGEQPDATAPHDAGIDTGADTGSTGLSADGSVDAGPDADATADGDVVDSGPDSSPLDGGSDADAAPEVTDGGVPPVLPDDAGATASVKRVNFAIRHVHLGDEATAPWQQFGYNLDGKVTTAQSTDVCTQVTNSNRKNQTDGPNGIDNSFGE
ncbi:MAG TPA: hypothetical protein VGI39_43840, partial [Polyangiaceae bacterium]